MLLGLRAIQADLNMGIGKYSITKEEESSKQTKTIKIRFMIQEKIKYKIKCK
jgi:hypothetical protein